MLVERIGTASQDAGRGAFFVGDHAGRAGKPSGQGHGQREGPWRYLALRVGARASMAGMPMRLGRAIFRLMTNSSSGQCGANRLLFSEVGLTEGSLAIEEEQFKEEELPVSREI